MTLNSPVTDLKGVGPSKAAALARLGAATVGDLLRIYPRAYQNRGAVQTVAESACFYRENGYTAPSSYELTVASEPSLAQIRKNMSILRFKAFDESGVCEITYFNQPFMKNVFHKGDTFRFWGRGEVLRGGFKLTNPVSEPIRAGEALLPIYPVYPLSQGLKQKFMQGLVKEALRLSLSTEPDPLPSDIIRERGLCSLAFAHKNIHFPDSMKSLEKARRRLAFDEVFGTACAVGLSRKKRVKKGAPFMKRVDITPLTSLFPYELTNAQKRSVSEICADMNSDAPMHRILCGDVGSGKTAVAATAAYVAIANGYQCAIMAPTEILAKQHYNDLSPLYEKLGLGTCLLCGSMTAKEKREARALVQSGTASLVIGTHALISEGVEFERLGLVITDEQHRFGVNQRAALQDKAGCAHNLVMSATPIPRTLSLVIYGDLEVSRLDEMPPGRKKVGTFRVDESYRERLLGFIRKQKAEGHSTYVVCPAIEESEKKKGEDPEELFDIVFGQREEDEPAMKAAVQFAAELSQKLPDMKIGFVHGKMKTAEKDEAMNSFVSGDTDVLVSTTVIEVGVNVPRATLMVIENAERFGLSQLHQLRGRVGRGDAKSYCILVSDTKNETSLARLDALCRLSDGFAVAEEDLRLRGPGDFFAVGGAFRQHGSSDMHFSATLSDGELISAAQESAKELLGRDPGLSGEEHKLLYERVSQMLESSENTIS